MEFSFQNVTELDDFIDRNVINTTEALEILECSRQNLFSLVERGVIKPIREMPKDKLFWKKDILKRAYYFYEFRIKIVNSKKNALAELDENLRIHLVYKEPVYEVVKTQGDFLHIFLRNKGNLHPRLVDQSLVCADEYVLAGGICDALWVELERKGSSLVTEFNVY